MFDMGFTELMLIGIVALVVIGPERLPGVARTAGKYFGRLKRFMTSVKADVEQELRADELRQILADQQRELDNIKDSMSDAGKAFEKEVNTVTDAVEPTTEDLGDTPSISEQSSVAGDADSAATAEPVSAEPDSGDAIDKVKS
ncbi:MAG: twin-arginine translocase subunit TatB [Gammaproteobacteria bacterium]|nr:twin-arginine translocase subunit TatB [Gammaproteobacteria bacterium]MCP4980444.1 twin-arginine translocase subunit TatB [Gammaproteobacteria bacterium]